VLVAVVGGGGGKMAGSGPAFGGVRMGSHEFAGSSRVYAGRSFDGSHQLGGHADRHVHSFAWQNGSGDGSHQLGGHADRHGRSFAWQNGNGNWNGHNWDHHHSHHHNRLIARNVFIYGGGYGSGYYDDCYWLRREALITGSPYWWDRYNECQAY
jgi:hypothetical protein